MIKGNSSSGTCEGKNSNPDRGYRINEYGDHERVVIYFKGTNRYLSFFGNDAMRASSMIEKCMKEDIKTLSIVEENCKGEYYNYIIRIDDISVYHYSNCMDDDPYTDESDPLRDELKYAFAIDSQGNEVKL